MLKRLEISALRGATRKFCLDFEADKTITDHIRRKRLWQEHNLRRC